MRTDGVQMDPRRSARRARRSPTATTRHYLPEKPRIYQTKAKNAQEAHEAIRPTDFAAPSARQRRRGAALRPDLQARDGEPDGLGEPRAHHRRRCATATGRHELRATGQVVQVPRLPRGLRGRPRPEGRGRGRRRGLLPLLRQGDAPAKTRRRRHPALHPAAAALFRGEPGQAAGGARHRPAFDLRLDAPDAEGPRICARSRRTASSPRKRAGC